MDKLISANSIIQKLISILNENGDMYLAGRIIGTIDSEPAAFDKEKVIEDLKDWKSDAEKWAAKYDEIGDTVNMDMKDIEARAFEWAIKTVEKGGVN